MSNLTEWIKYELYPALYDSIDRAFPELNFTKFSGGWRSSLKLDLTNPKQKRTDKTVVSKNRPYLILEQGGDVLTYITYVERRDRVNFIQAVKTLADIVGLQLPKGDFNSESYQRYKDQTTLLEDCNSYFIFCLENSPGADKVKAYLSSRGYSDEDVKAMELGYIPDQDKLFKYLLSKGYTQSLIDEVVTIKTDTRIGSTHSLTLPWRSGGSIKGFKFRTIGDDTPKYLNTKGLDRSGGFFNLLEIKGDKDIVIVEGELDSLSATARGVDNIVATGGSSITSDQVKDAIRRGAKTFTICFDQEPGKEERTHNSIVEAIKVIQGEGVNRVYIVTLPDLGGGKTDPDSLIKEKGVEAFRDAIKTAKAHYEYKLNEVVGKYTKLQRELTSKEIDTLLEEVTIIGSELQPLDRNQFIKLFLDYYFTKDLGITQEAIDITVDKLQATKDKEAQDKELNKLLSEAKDLHGKGQTDKALELLDSKVKEVKLKDKATEFSSLLLPIKEDELKERQANKPDSINSGYTIGGEPLLLPSGAISIFTAPTSHGKTTFLINLALNVATTCTDKETYLFSYEEDSDSILINTLNTYLNTELSFNNRRSIKSYFSTGSTEYIKKETESYFIETKNRFFNELISTRRLNIHYSSYNSDTLIEAIRYLHKHANPGAIFIDYIQLLNLPEGKYKTYSRQEEIKEICIALKDVAVETGLPIILGAQFNREVISPLKIHATKIGEAGDIERIANLIVGFWNNNFKPIATEGELSELNSKGAIKPDTIFATILKNRGGRIGLEETLSFNGNTGAIKSPVKKENILKT